ncbi:MAG: hypothetical protein AB1298_09200 [Bacteroidota bacterium]
MKEKLFVILFSSFLVLFFAGCTDPLSSPRDIPINDLLSAPDTLELENQKIVMTTYMWRDFMPISPPNGKPLITIVYIETTDSSVISPSISADAIYIINRTEIWKSYFSDEQPAGESKPFRIARIARDGPKWGPGIYVDVVVQLKVNRTIYLLKATRQYIGRTD